MGNENVLTLEPVAAAPRQDQPLVPQSATPAALLELAMRTDPSNLDRLERLMAMQERWQAGEAKRAWVVAMTEFKANPPVVFKDKLVSFDTQGGGNTSYRHATLADIVQAVCKGLADHKLSHRWDVKQEGGAITVTCIITHADGHSESVSMTSLPDNSGKKNAIQSVASTVTYLQRYTLQSLTGIAAQDRDEDDDGRGSEPVERIDEKQAATIQDAIEATSTDKSKFLEFFGVQQISDLPAAKYNEAIGMLKQKAKRAAK